MKPLITSYLTRRAESTRGTLRAFLHLPGSSAPSAGRLCALAACAAAFLALTAAPAQAFRGHEFEKSFGAAGSGNGQFSEPSALAVNLATGQVYVLDQGNGRIERFSSAGAYEAQFDGSGTPATAFDFGAVPLTGGIAVDNSCYLKKLSGSACSTADPSNGDVYVTDPGGGAEPGKGVVDKFSPAGVYLNQLQQASGGAPFEFESIVGVTPAGIGVDTSGTVWVAQEAPHISGDVASFTNKEANTFVSSRQLQNTGGQLCPGFAVDSEDSLYARKAQDVPVCTESPQVSKFDSAGHALAAPFDPEETSAVAVDLTNNEVFLDNVTSVGAFGPSGALQERFGSGHLTAGTGLAVGRAPNPLYSTVYVADSSADRVAVFPPEPPGPPTIESDGVTAVTATSATLAVEINPRSEPGEAPTEYRFEYGPCATIATCASSPYEQSTPVPAGKLAPEFEAHTATAHLQNLQPHTAYHFRAFAENSHSLEPAIGEEKTFTTQTTAPFALPDARAWEQVSPTDKRGANLWPIGVGVIQAAAGGDAISYLASAPTEADPQGNALFTQVLSTRGPLGWSSRDLSVPHAEATGTSVGQGFEYRFFSNDLSLAVIHPFGAFEPTLSPEASEQTAYLRTDFPPGNPAEPCAQSCYRPLVTGAEGFADVPPGTAFGEEGCGSVICGPFFRGATADLSHVVLNSKVALTPTPLPANGAGLYEWSAAAPPAEALRLISVLPGTGAKAAIGALGYFGKVARNAISADGSRVVFSTGGSEPHLYLRYNATEAQSALNGGGECTEAAMACTIQLDAVQGGSGANEPGPLFQLASADGSKVFFTDHQRLTADSGAGAPENEADLYECRIEEVAGQLKCDLTDLSPESGGEPARVQGLVIGASAEGSSLYFVADGVLAHNTVDNGNGPEEALPGDCRVAVAENPGSGTCNLYLRRDGATRLVAVLSGPDSPAWMGEAFYADLGHLTARVSPNGRWLAFMSQRPLSGYDNRDAASGKRDQEVFLYDAAANGGEGKLICASCDPTGARPRGVEVGEIGFPGLIDPQADPSVWLAANLPGWTPYSLGTALYQSRYLSDSGRLFFNSSDALVPADTNGTEDVYQYEPPKSAESAPASDTCTESSPTYGPASGGCVDLISNGTSNEESAFLDASESGNDVFFLTSSQLSHRDFDTSLDVYDASVGGGEAEAIKPVECTGDACQQPATPPNFETPGTSLIDGPENEHPANHKHHKKHHRKKHHKRSHKRAAGNHRRASK